VPEDTLSLLADKARIIQREGMVFLESTEKQGAGPDERITGTELGFIWSGIEKPMFSPTRTASENADLLLEKLDPYTIINCTDLFTRDGCGQVARIYGPQRDLAPEILNGGPGRT
jgi:hypothetical protein